MDAPEFFPDHINDEVEIKNKLSDLSFNVWAVGRNSFSKLGIIHRMISQLTQIPDLKAVEVKSSGNHTLAIDVNNNVYVWGSNNSGQLGLGDPIDRSVPTLLPGIKAKLISCSQNTSFIIDLEDKLLGLGNYNYSTMGPLPSYHECVPRELLPIKVREVSSGFNFTIIRDFEDKIWGWGSNNYGQLGINGDFHLNPVLLTNFRVKQVSTGLFHTLIIDYDDNVWVCGFNANGTLGIGLTNTNKVSTFTQIEGIKAKRVICGQNSSAIINFENELFMFGDNTYGQLGLGDNIHRLVPTKVKNLKVKDVSSSYYHSILLDVKGNVWVCGTKWENFDNFFNNEDNLLNLKLLPNTKARKILALKDAAIIIGINDK